MLWRKLAGKELRDLDVGKRYDGRLSAPINDRYEDLGVGCGLNRLDVADRFGSRVFGIVMELIAKRDLPSKYLSKIRFGLRAFSNDRCYSSPPRSSAGA